MYLKDQPEATPAPSMDGFKRRSVCDIEVPHVVANTPTIDKRIEEAMAFAEEADDAYIAEKANAVFGYLVNLIDFVNSETVFVNYEYDEPLMFDTPVLGNPFEWDEAYFTNAVMTTCGVEED
jgi:hypothetical protein